MPALQNQYVPQITFHPGRTLADKLEELGMGSKDFARRTGYWLKSSELYQRRV